jgi:hypothetical protein
LRNIGSIDIAVIEEYLTEQGSGIAFSRGPKSPDEFYKLPLPPNEYQGFRVTFDEGDVDRLYLWLGFALCAGHKSCHLTDIPTVLHPCTESRVRPFIEGDPASGKGPLDLRTATDMEIVTVSNDLENGNLYIIDGNHRLIAHYLIHKSIKDVPAFACIRPKMLQWAYVQPDFKHS